jgi:hypothetical protein
MIQRAENSASTTTIPTLITPTLSRHRRRLQRNTTGPKSMPLFARSDPA